ncbi:LysR substrate-binding domain-containing protein [Kordiimonas aquimaris]|uniref:LysR substrate-binding domain-containing protein n=1 Tax=Kordiimonas aquimaris TaxID=707591 RepID=UPI0021D2AA92|nr:LysR substrate-binding domain-containing protein [Kordiimonas aquimaris]
MRYRLQTLSGLLAFDAAARTGSLTLAAKELGRTQSAVSQQVKGLEEHLGLKLFIRRPREIVLTADGRVLAHSVEEALRGIDQTIKELDKHKDENVIRLSVYHSFAIQWLIPRLPKFALKHPEIDVRLNADDRKVDVASEGYDLAVRYGWFISQTPANVTHIRREQYIPVYAASLSPDRALTAADLDDFPLLGYEDPVYWREWLKLNDVDLVNADYGQTYSHSGLLVQAAMVGVGIGMAPLTTAAEALSDGRLKCIKSRPLELDHCFYLVSAEETMPEKVQWFADWIIQELLDMEEEAEAYFL